MVTPTEVPPRYVELRCADVFVSGCDVSWRSLDREDVMLLARHHGEIAHGFTPAWFKPENLAQIDAAMTT